jgi:hypothetical protein
MGLEIPETGQLLVAGFDICGLKFVSSSFIELIIIS